MGCVGGPQASVMGGMVGRASGAHTTPMIGAFLCCGYVGPIMVGEWVDLTLGRMCAILGYGIHGLVLVRRVPASGRGVCVLVYLH